MRFSLFLTLTSIITCCRSTSESSQTPNFRQHQPPPPLSTFSLHHLKSTTTVQSFRLYIPREAPRRRALQQSNRKHHRKARAAGCSPLRCDTESPPTSPAKMAATMPFTSAEAELIRCASLRRRTKNRILTVDCSSLNEDEIPAKLRCAICSKLAVNAYKTPCCEQLIDESCEPGPFLLPRRGPCLTV